MRWYGAFAIDPLALNDVPFFLMHDFLHRLDLFVCHEAEAPGLSRLLVNQDHTVNELSESLKVFSEVRLRQIVWEASHKYLSILGVI